MTRSARVAAGVCAALVAVTLSSCGGASEDLPQPATSTDVAAGQAAFERTCAACHGPGARGTDQGPPLVDKVYEPSHHGDASFLLAVRNGVPQHHWSFGDMPPQPSVTEAEVAAITAYVRSLQRAAGIE